jgi:hypothetical protein
MRKIIALAGALALAYATVAMAAQVSDPLTVTIVPATVAQPGCDPTNPPPEAAAAGMTKLAYCLDGGSAHAAAVDNWLSCPDTSTTTPEWFLGANSSGLGCNQLFSQTTDPVSGKTVLDLHWPSTPGSDLMTMDTCHPCTASDQPPSSTNHIWSVGHYTEFRTRLTPSLAPGAPHDYGPSLFEWGNPNVSSHGLIENDVVELNFGANNGTGSDMAIHDWGMGNLGGGLASGAAGQDVITVTNLTGIAPDPFAPPLHPMCIDGPGIPHRTLFTWTVTGTGTLNITLANTDWIAFSAGNLPVTLSNTPITWGYCSTGYAAGNYSSFVSSDMHTYGTLQTTDGSSYIQQCGFLDGVLAPAPVPGQGYGFNNNCGEMDISHETFLYTQPHYLTFWGGTGSGPTTDQYIEFIAVWTCPNGLPDGTDPTCAGPKQSPSTIAIVR